MNKAYKNRLAELAPGQVQFDRALSDLTTLRLGGPADVLIQPKDIDTLRAILNFVHSEGLPLFVLGGGSNVLFSDEGYRGVVIRLGSGFGQLEIVNTGGKDVFIEGGAAARTAAMVALTRREGLTGFEFMAGIPGRIGGALAMNAGVPGREIMDALSRLELLYPDGWIHSLGRPQIKVSYRGLDLPTNVIVLGGFFQLRSSSPEDVEEEIKRVLGRRKERQPRGVRSAGCVFKNPSGDSAGRLIDEAGLKGLSIGGAWVAREHANFIVHKGGATSGHVIELMRMVREQVYRRLGIELEPEIVIVSADGGTGNAAEK
jgi:UDP-N-acetylmuramate dehydrogenase